MAAKPPRLSQRRRDLKTALLYGGRLAREFRGTLLGLVAAVTVGAILFAITPHKAFADRPPPLADCLLAAWLALFAQTVFSPPETWYLALLYAVYPLFGFGLLGEGIVRLGLLMLSRRHGEKEWMLVMASTYRDHVILCGLGHLGFRVLLHLREGGALVVALEKEAEGRFVGEAKQMKLPVLTRDMRDDQALVDAGVTHARAIVIATNDDLANLEVALDARRLNPKIRVILRLFDQRVADKLKSVGLIDEAFSSSSLAAPAVSAMALRHLEG